MLNSGKNKNKYSNSFFLTKQKNITPPFKLNGRSLTTNQYAHLALPKMFKMYIRMLFRYMFRLKQPHLHDCVYVPVHLHTRVVTRLLTLLKL